MRWKLTRRIPKSAEKESWQVLGTQSLPRHAGTDEVSCDLHVSISNSHSLSFTTLHSIYIDFVPGLGSWHSVMSIVCDLLAAVKYDHGAGYTTPTGDLYSNALEAHIPRGREFSNLPGDTTVLY